VRKVSWKHRNITIKVLKNYTFIKIYGKRTQKLSFLPKFRQISAIIVSFVEKSIIFDIFYVEISIILEYIYVEKSIIFEGNGEEACSNARHTTN